MTQPRKPLVALAAIAVAGLTIFAMTAFGANKAPSLPNGYGSLSYKVRAGLMPHRLGFEKVFDSRGKWLSTSAGNVGRGSSYEVFKPGRYKLKAYVRHCRHCQSFHSDPVGPKFNQCSHQFRIKEGERTRGVLRIHRNRACSIALARPRRIDGHKH